MKQLWMAGAMLLGCTTAPPTMAPALEGPSVTAPSVTASSTTTTPTLDDVIARDGVPFEPGTLPPSLIERMAAQRVVMVGEHHGYREHHDLLLDVVKALHEHGTRWVLFEGFQAESWSANAYVTGAIDTLSAPTKKYFGYTLDRLAAFNQTLPDAEREHVAFIDIDHRPWAFPLALAHRLAHRDMPACVATFVDEAGWERSLPFDEAKAAFERTFAAGPRAYRRHLQALARDLKAGVCLAQSPVREEIAEMADVALDSLRIRAIWDGEGEHAAHPLREDAIKAMVDRRLETTTGPVVLNMGGFHLQKTHVMGTPKQWLGEHLGSPTHPAGGAVLRLYVQFARAQRTRDGETFWWSLEDERRPGELLGSVHRHTPDRAVFLPVSEPWWSRNVLPVSYMYQVVEHAPGAVFDGYILLPEGHQLD
ncbi:MAG: ChaN family lipoprotein [Polyangiaceae bacterium]